MNCLFLLLLLCCCGNKNNGCGCDNSYDNSCDNNYGYENSRGYDNNWNRNNDCDCDCDESRSYFDNNDRRGRRDNDYERNDNRREARVFPPFPGEDCGCNE